MFKTMPMMMRIMMTLAMIMAREAMVLLVKRIVVQVHHAGEGGGEAHPVGDRAVSVQPHHLVLLRHIVEKTEKYLNFTICIDMKVLRVKEATTTSH